MRTASVANWFIERALQEKQALTPMQVQKLMYLAESAYGATFHQDLVPTDTYKAWEHGPVDTSVYHSLKRYGKAPVKEPIFCAMREEISEEADDIFETVWEYFGHLSASSLRNLTHDVGPWEDYYDPMVPHRSIPSTRVYGAWPAFLKSAVVKKQERQKYLSANNGAVSGSAHSFILDADTYEADQEWISSLNGGVLKTS